MFTTQILWQHHVHKLLIGPPASFALAHGAMETVTCGACGPPKASQSGSRTISACMIDQWRCQGVLIGCGRHQGLWNSLLQQEMPCSRGA